MTKVSYDVVTYSQVLYSGTWEDGNWDWELKTVGSFKTYKEAKKYLAAITICDDLTLARLFKETTYQDEDGYTTDEELLVEKTDNGKLWVLSDKD